MKTFIVLLVAIIVMIGTQIYQESTSLNSIGCSVAAGIFVFGFMHDKSLMK